MVMGLGHVEAIAAFTAVAAVVLAVAVTLGTSKRQRRLPARIILVRHGESKGNATTATKEEYRRTQDHLIELTELGQQQALEAGERLARILHPSSGSATRAKFFVSPYARCRHTLDAILSAVPPEARVGEVTVDNLLREFDRGYHGQTHDDVMAWNLARREYGMCQYRFQNGESLEDVYARASTWVALFHSFLDLGWVGCDDTVVIVCHAGLMLQVAKRLLGQPVEGFKPTTLPNCAFFVFERYTVSTDGRADSSSVACYAPDPATHDILEWLPRKSDGTLTTAGEATEAAHRIVRSMSPGPLVFPL